MNANNKPRRPLLKRTSVRILLGLLVLIIAGLWFIRPTPSLVPSSDEPMKAIVYHEYGTAEVLRLEDTRRPLPTDDQVLIKVRAAAVNPLDWHYMRGTPYFMRLMVGYTKPVDPRMGVDVAGEVVAVGKNVTQFKPGDQVFGGSPAAFAEYAPANQSRVVLKPADITFEQAAAVPVAAVTALQALRDNGHLQRGQKVLINGASGGVGTFAVQIAKALGAEVTGVCSTRNVELVHSLGADHVVDYTKEDVTKGAYVFDVVLDNVGNLPLSAVRKVMSPKGTFVLVGGGGPDAGSVIGPMWGSVEAMLYSAFSSQDFGTMLSSITAGDLTFVKDMMETRKVTPVIDRSYPLSDVPEAIRYLEKGRARGKVIITVGDSAAPAISK